MKDGIHPQFYTDAAVSCACGNAFVTGSTKKTISVEICSNCHPFYTGQQRFVDTEGRIDKFARKQKLAEAKKTAVENLKTSKAQKKDKKVQDSKTTLKDLFQQAKK